MKKLILFTALGFIFCGNALLAQTAVSSDPFDVQTRFYRLALKNYDLQAATVALYNMQALKPERTDLSDSLALLYFASEKYPQSYLIGEEILKANPKRKDMLELVAVSKQNLGMIKESLADYEKLAEVDKSLFYVYQMATLQYQLKRYGECVASLDKIISSPEADKQKVNIRLQNGTQDVPMKAAAYNVKGICAIELNQEDAARDNFTKALEIFPDFSLAKGNLDAINKRQAAATKSSSTDSKPSAAQPKTTSPSQPKAPAKPQPKMQGN